ncbi:MAG: glycosyltransferase family 4 protein [Algibacter sp.]
MKNLLYIGNKLSGNGKTETTIDVLTQLLGLEGYIVNSFSNKKNKFIRLFDMLFNIIKYSKGVDYVLIDTYSTSNFYYAYFCSQLCRFFKLKYIPILHGGNLPLRLKNNPKLSKSIFNNAYRNIAPSGYMMSNFESFGYSNLDVIPNVIEIEKYPFKLRTYDDVKLLWVRSFSEIYNPNLAIDLLFKLQQEGVEASLCMVGPEKDGSLNKAKIYAKSLNVEVQFTGKLSKKEWIKCSEDYNIFINTTNFDNMPVSVIEAMALGLPVVSTNVGGMPFLIENEKEGFLVNPDDSNLFMQAIIRILTKPKESQRMAVMARKKVEQFDWEIVRSKWNDVLR